MAISEYTRIGRAVAATKADVVKAEAELRTLHERHAAELMAATAELHARQEEERKAADEKLATARYWRDDWKAKFEAATDPQTEAASQEPEATGTSPDASADEATTAVAPASSDDDGNPEASVDPDTKTALFEGRFRPVSLEM